jgi:hypothetical protein
LTIKPKPAKQGGHQEKVLPSPTCLLGQGGLRFGGMRPEGNYSSLMLQKHS